MEVTHVECDAHGAGEERQGPMQHENPYVGELRSMAEHTLFRKARLIQGEFPYQGDSWCNEPSHS